MKLWERHTYIIIPFAVPFSELNWTITISSTIPWRIATVTFTVESLSENEYVVSRKPTFVVDSARIKIIEHSKNVNMYTH